MIEKLKYGIIEENNIVSQEEYVDRAKKTLNIISDALAHSLGYYGTTTIIEDNIKGNIITKDGYTILKALAFGIDDTLSNTLLRSIKDISHSLVVEVGDGSTSAVVTSQSLFEHLTAENPKFKNIPKKVIVDELNKIAKDVEKIIKKQYATPINEDNFEKLLNIASVSNNNDDDTGQMLYDIYKEIGKDGFVFMENSLVDKDHYEISNGIEISNGYLDDIYSNKANKIESEYYDCSVLMFKGEVREPHLAWLNDLIASFYSLRGGKPLVLLANGYDLDVLDSFKFNKVTNARNGIDYDFAPGVFNATHNEAFEDLAVYLGAEIIDLDDDPEIVQAKIKCFDPTQFGTPVEKNMFYEKHLGFAKKVYMNINVSRYVEGKGTKEEIDGRVEVIDKRLDYYRSLEGTENVDFEMYRLNKRKANLTSKIVKLYVAGRTSTEIETRKYLLEDAIHASKSALEHGYVSGGNLLVSKVIYHHLLKEEGISEIRQELLNIILSAFTGTFYKVLENSGMTESDIQFTIEHCIKDGQIYNLKTKQYEADNETSIINSAMTDIRIMESVFSIISLLVTSNQYIQKSPRRLDMLR